MDRGDPAIQPRILAALDDGDAIHAVVHLPDATIVLSGQRLIVARHDRMALIVPIEAVRRIQFDVEKRIAATMVIVPEHASYEPQVLAVPAGSFREAAELLVQVGLRLAAMDEGRIAPVA